MNEAEVRQVLGDIVDTSDNGLFNPGRYLSWTPGQERAVLDGTFTATELEAIVWWMRKHSA